MRNTSKRTRGRHKWTGWTASLPGLTWDYKIFWEQQRRERNEGGSSTVRLTLGSRKTEDKTWLSNRWCKYKAKQRCFQLHKSGRTDYKCFLACLTLSIAFSLSSVVSLFQACGTSTEKALLPIRRHIRGTLRSPRPDALSDDRATVLECRVQWRRQDLVRGGARN